jgi:alcohol dehydrogenase class IV
MEKVINLPSEVRFGFGALQSLPSCIEQLSGKNVLVVTGTRIVASGLLDKVQRTLDDGGYASTIFSEVHPNPPTSDCIKGLSVFRKGSCDTIVALGGGSVIDAAKGIQLLSTHDGDLADYSVAKDGFGRIRRGMPPLIAIPTTSGTGSEVSYAMVVTVEETNVKTAIASPFLIPAVAIVDPDMTMGLPKDLTAATGMDVLTHCIEGYVAASEEPLSDAMMLCGIQLCADYLKKAVEDGTDKESRKWMAFASMIGGIGINVKGLGVCHSLSHQLSTDHDIPHGLANAIMLPYVMEFNLDYATEKFAKVARIFGVADETVGDLDAARASVTAVSNLVSELGMDASLRSYGVSDASIRAMAPKSMNDVCTSGNPRPADEDLMRGLYVAAL